MQSRRRMQAGALRQRQAGLVEKPQEERERWGRRLGMWQGWRMSKKLAGGYHCR